MSRTTRKTEYGSAAGTNQRVELRQRGWLNAPVDQAERLIAAQRAWRALHV